MALTRGLGAYDDGTPEEPGAGTTPRDVRMALSGLFPSPGILPGSDSPLVSGTSGWSYRVGRGFFVTQLTASDGVQLFANDGAVTVDTNAAGVQMPQGPPSSGLTRTDIIWVRHPTNDENGDTSSAPVFGVQFGNPGSPGLPPSIPAGALEIGRNVMSSVGTTPTSTSSAGNTITQGRHTATRGVIVTRTAAERTAARALASDTSPILVYHLPAMAGQRLQILDATTERVLRTFGKTLQVASALADPVSGSGSGTLGVTPGVTVADTTVNRIVEIEFGAAFTVFGSGTAEVTLRRGTTAVCNVRINGAVSGTASFSEPLAAGATATYQVVVSGSTGSWTVTNDTRFTFLRVKTSEAG